MKAGRYKMGRRKTAREHAFALLERSDRTEQQLRQKLLGKGCMPDEVEETIAFLKEYHYIDDMDYASRYIRSYSSQKSVLQIGTALAQRGVDKDLIVEALAEGAVDEEGQIRRLLLKRGYCPGERMEAGAYRRMAGALARKGFRYETVRRVMDGMEEQA